MIFGGMQRCSTIDFPGYLSCVLFARGCDLNCFYCHNRALLDSSGPVIPMEEVLSFLEKRRGLLEGVVLSGGEPALQEDLPELLRTIKDMGFYTKLDTNGQHLPVIQKLIRENLIDYAAVDFKAPLPDYGWVCGDDEGYHRAFNTIELLMQSGIPFEARTTLYPGLQETALLDLLQALPSLLRYRLNLFRMPETYLPSHALLLRRPAISASDLMRLTSALKQVQPNIEW